MKRYEKYKDSGIEWMGQMPFQWKKLKIGRSFNRIGSGTTPNTNNDAYYEGGEINWLNTGDLNDSYITSTSKKITQLAIEEISTLKLFPINSIVIALYGATIGKLGHLKIETTTNQACCVLTESDFIESRYLFYFLLGARDYIISKAYGGGQPNISQDLIKQLYIVTPSKTEQIQIVNFLDHQTAIIDELIGKKEKLIEKLKEKRQAIINEAVTKGLDPNTKMKDSGIEWLGEIPKSWRVVSLRHLTNKIGSGVTPKGGAEVYTEEGVAFIRSQNVHFNGLRLDDVVKIDFATHNKMSGSRVALHDVLLNITGASIGRCCVVELDEEMNVNQHVCIIRPNSKVDFRFLNLALQSEVGQVQIKIGTTGGNREGLTFEAIKEFIIPLPDKSSQSDIVRHVENSIRRIEDLEIKNKSQIEKLKEYRQSLISEAVTGKIDVSDWEPIN